jgi:hypothetical protein
MYFNASPIIAACSLDASFDMGERRISVPFIAIRSCGRINTGAALTFHLACGYVSPEPKSGAVGP